jgi:hypothetical protein
MKGMIPTALGIPPRTFGNRLPMYPLFPKNLKIMSITAVPIADKTKTYINAKSIDAYIIKITIIKNYILY